jgi:hypothetical protein
VTALENHPTQSSPHVLPAPTAHVPPVTAVKGLNADPENQQLSVPPPGSASVTEHPEKLVVEGFSV